MADKRDFLLYVPEGNRVIHVMDGTGDNLLPEDIREGYVDYINYETFVIRLDDDHDPVLAEEDGGMILLKRLYSDHSIAELAELVVEMECMEKVLYYLI